MIHMHKKDIVKAFRNHSKVWEKSKNQGNSSSAYTYKMVLFYAVECGLKGLFMDRNKLHRTDTENIHKESAAGFRHDLNKLLSKVNMDRFKVPKAITKVNRQVDDREQYKRQIEAQDLHQVWRYGKELDEQKEDRCIETLEKILGELGKPRYK